MKKRSSKKKARKPPTIQVSVTPKKTPGKQIMQVDLPVVSTKLWGPSPKFTIQRSPDLKIRVNTKSKSQEAFLAGLDTLTNLL